MAEMTFLELCQRLAQESGTISGTLPSTTVSQTGRLKKVVDWVKLSWRSIQLSKHRQWQWMKDDFSASTQAGVQSYDGSADFSITRFHSFEGAKDEEEIRYTITDPSVGASSEAQLGCYPYRTFKTVLLRGATTQAKPTQFAISPDKKMWFPNLQIPDAVYTIKGPYIKTPQEFTADNDVPELPDEYHDLIWMAALRYLAQLDESPQIALFQLMKIEMFNDLLKDQLPPWENTPAWFETN